MKKISLSLFALCCSTAMAQSSTDILIGDLSIQNELLSVTNLTNITAREGYDNQPFFMPNGNGLLYTSMRGSGEKQQTDSFLYDFTSGQAANLTQTPESEYSPTLMPGGQHFSVIWAAQGKQKLWRYPIAGGTPDELLHHVEPVGYHAWIDSEQVILFILGDTDAKTPHTLQLANVTTQNSKVLDENIGPSLYKIPSKELMSYSAVKPGSSAEDPIWELKSYDPKSGAINVLTTLPSGAYYYAWSADGKALAAQGTHILQWDSTQDDAQWIEFVDVKETCPGGITRIAVNADNSKIALVCTQ